MRAIVCSVWIGALAQLAGAQANWGILEDFESGFLSPWVLFGDPESLILSGAEELGSNVLVPNGDDRCPSGIRLGATAPWGEGAGFAVHCATDVASDGRGEAPQELLFGVHRELFTSGGCSIETPPRALLQLRVDTRVDGGSIALLDAEGVVASRDYPPEADRNWHQLAIQQQANELVASVDGVELGRIVFAAPRGMGVFLAGRHPDIVHVFDDLRYLLPQSTAVEHESFGRLKALYASGLPRARR